MGLTLVKEENAVEISFEDFWKAYPRRQNKKAAQAIWKRIDPSRYEAILCGIDNWKRTDQWQRDGGQYIPMPTSFLNGERWEDEVDILIAAASPCQWPRCKSVGTLRYGSRDYCEAHVQAFKRGETP